MRSGSHARRKHIVVMFAVLIAMSACGGDHPSTSEAERLIRQYGRFQIPKTVRIPRRIILASGYGNARPSLHLKPEDWQYFDWVTQSLNGAGFVTIVDNARPMSFGMNMSMPR